MNPYFPIFLILSFGFACGSGINNKSLRNAPLTRGKSDGVEMKSKISYAPRGRGTYFKGDKSTKDNNFAEPKRLMISQLDLEVVNDAPVLSSQQSVDGFFPIGQVHGSSHSKPLLPTEDVRLPNAYTNIEKREKGGKMKGKISESEEGQRHIKSLQTPLIDRKNGNNSLKEKIPKIVSETVVLKNELEKQLERNEQLDREIDRLKSLLKNQTQIKNNYDKSVNRHISEKKTLLQEIADLRKSINNQQKSDAWKIVFIIFGNH